MTEGLWSLPKSWKWESLGRLCEINMGQSPPSRTYNTEGQGLPFFQGKADFGDLYPKTRMWCSSPVKIAQPGDVLISVRAPVGSTNLAAESCCIGRGLAALRPRDGAAAMFILYWLRKFETNIEKLGKGSAFGAITKKVLAEIEIPVAPPEEQQRIVAKIEALFDRIREAKRLRGEASKDAETVKDAAVVTAFKEGRSRGWRTKTIGELILAKPQYGISQKATEEPDGIPILRMGNIVDGGFLFDDLKYIKLAPQEARKYFLNQGDILFNRTNSAELVGKSAVFTGGQEAVFASYLIRIVPDSEKALSEFLVAYMNSSFGREYFQAQLTRAIGQVNINAQKLQAMPVPVPSVEEQRELVTYLKNIAATVQTLNERHVETDAELKRLEQSILDRAFRGEL